MDRLVSVMRSRRSGIYILHPFGTFRGYGAYVGINPYRELPADVAPNLLGELVVGLLACAGSTGFSFTEREEYLRTTTDDETRRIREEDGLDIGRTTSGLARRFLHAEVKQHHRQKS